MSGTMESSSIETTLLQDLLNQAYEFESVRSNLKYKLMAA